MVLGGGCDKKREQLIEKVAGPSASATEPPPPPAPRLDRVPDITVDSDGLYMGGERASLAQRDGAQKLEAIVARYQLTGKTVVVTALRNARTPHVAAVVTALTDHGAAEILVRTQDRDRKETTLKLTPDRKLGAVPPCSVVTLMLKERQTVSWPQRGGLATKYPRGMAGPDMSQTLDGITKQLKACPSAALLFSGDDSVEWGLTFDLAKLVATAQPPLTVDRYALLREVPTVGRPARLTP
ncbi:MAG: hypothetical protein EOO75_21445 [Myxococcales bacterium]|nr:MAG: hypothetical protein EOO75_21445 [Myxococcales bacterium]